MKIIAIIVALAIATPARAASLPTPAFGNGCSGGVSWIYRHVLHKVPIWEGCCVDHDRAYAKGGSPTRRAKADNKLLACVAASGDLGPAIEMWAVVRLIGQVFFPLNWRKDDQAVLWWFSRAGAE